MTEAIIRVENLSVTLSTPNGRLNAVHEVSFSLRRGGSLGIVGESGSGKSMTALALMNLLPKNAERCADTLQFLGHDLLQTSDMEFSRKLAGQRIGMIFQEPMTSLNPVYSIGRQLTEGVVRAGIMTESKAIKHALDLMDRVGLPDPKARFDHYPHQFSGGQRQRVMIAMSLMSQPELIIADEPTTALDVTVQAQILTLMADIQHEFGMAMILITHDLGVIAQTVDRVAVMYSVEFIENGPTEDVLTHARHPYTSALVRAAPEPRGDRKRLDAIPGQIQPVYGQRKTCIFVNRCSVAEARCHDKRPESQPVSETHNYRCLLAPDRIDELQQVKPKAIIPCVASSDKVIEVKDLTRVFETRRLPFGILHSVRALDGINLRVNRGETFALVGESGSGKSTLARILLGLDLPTQGEVRIDGRPVASATGLDRAKLIQPIFQDPYSSLNPRHTVGEIIGRPLAVHGIGNSASQTAEAHNMMGLVGLPEAFFFNYPNQLSGGQRQRVAIARALIMKPAILICDEPTSALDVSVQAQILNLLTDLKDEVGLTLFLITHDIGVVHQLSDQVAVMQRGRIVEMGPAAEILQNPQDPYTRELLSSVPAFKPSMLNTLVVGAADAK
jgi:peptide/nickel transport system ATP-binding protein